MSHPSFPPRPAPEDAPPRLEVKHTRATEDVVDISLIYDTESQLCARIVNVTTVHTVVWYDGTRDRPVTFNLANLAEETREVLGFSFDPCAMPSAKHNIEFEPLFGKTTVSLYKTGKIVQTGCRTPEQARLAAEMFAKRALGFFNMKLGVREFEVVNMVATIDFAEAIDLGALQSLLGSRCVFEDREKARAYGAAVVDYVLGGRDKITVLVWPTGVAVLIGVKTRQQISDSMRVIKKWSDLSRAIVPVRPAPRMTNSKLAAARQALMAMYGVTDEPIPL